MARLTDLSFAKLLKEKEKISVSFGDLPAPLDSRYLFAKECLSYNKKKEQFSCLLHLGEYQAAYFYISDEIDKLIYNYFTNPNYRTDINSNEKQLYKIFARSFEYDLINLIKMIYPLLIKTEEDKDDLRVDILSGYFTNIAKVNFYSNIFNFLKEEGIINDRDYETFFEERIFNHDIENIERMIKNKIFSKEILQNYLILALEQFPPTIEYMITYGNIDPYLALTTLATALPLRRLIEEIKRENLFIILKHFSNPREIIKQMKNSIFQAFLLRDFDTQTDVFQKFFIEEFPDIFYERVSELITKIEKIGKIGKSSRGFDLYLLDLQKKVSSYLPEISIKKERGESSGSYINQIKLEESTSKRKGYSLEELKSFARLYSLPVSGTKEILVKRLKNYFGWK